jgi:putative spermidine/putrescine transport system substrate-binding protein
MKHLLKHASAIFVAGALAAGANVAVAQDKGSVVVASWGGSFQDAQRETMFKPFEEETGIKVIEATGPSLAKIKAMVESGNTEWDVSGITPGDLMILAREGLAEKIDYDNYLKSMMPDIVPEVVHPYGIGNFFYTKVIAYSTEAFPGDNHPQSWADVWDVEKFPGPRMIDAGDWVVPPLEYALLADGVSKENLYPLDMERAYASIAKIKPHVVKFATASAMPPQALVDGEVVVAPATLGRIFKLMKDGAPVNFVWNGGLMQFDYWMIPKGAKNYENAMKFIEFATRPEIQAALVKIQPLGPVNLKTFDYLTEDEARILPSHPDHLDKQVLLNAEFWATVGPDGKNNLEKNQEMWNKFTLQ